MMQGLKSRFLLGLMIFSLVLGSSLAMAGDGNLTILATSDMHSVLKPYGAYSSATDENYNGGFLPVAERIIEQKVMYGLQGHGVLTLDSGDTVAGTYFHYAYKGLAEMGLMSALYDATTIGNHEFDWTPDAMAGAIQAALGQGITPAPVISSNITSWGDSSLQYFKDVVIYSYMVKNAEILPGLPSGINVGIMGLMTSGTAALGQPGPIQFSDLSTVEGITAALGVAGQLQAMGVDVVVCLAHNGISYDMGLAQYAAQFGVKLDVIISGHDHSPNPSMIEVGNTKIIQVGAYNNYLGRLSLTVQNRTVTGADFALETINADNPDVNGEPTVGGVNPDPVGWATLVGTYNTFASAASMAYYVGQDYPTGWGEPTVDGVTWADISGGAEQDNIGVAYPWQTYNLSAVFNQMATTLYHAPPGTYTNPPFWAQVPAVTEIDLVKVEYAESNLGDLITDSMFLRGALTDLSDPNTTVPGLPGSPADQVTDFAVEANGTIRFDIPVDENGITLSDAYQVLPLGIGLKSFDLVNGDPPYDSQGNPMLAPGYDLMKFYMTGADLKKAMELGAASFELGDVFWLNWSGLTFDFDLSQDILNRVSNAKVAGVDIVDTAVYKGTTSTYVGSSFLLLGSLLQPAVNAGALTQEQFESFASMMIYLDYEGITPITDITGSLALTYCGKAWLAFADFIMWPWWYGGQNGMVSAYMYGTADDRMNDITPSGTTINTGKKGTKHYVPVVISKLLGTKIGDPAYKGMFDLNQDGSIDSKDLELASKLTR